MPLAASVPLQLPKPVQLAALTDDQVIVVVLPTGTDVAASASDGAAGSAVAVKVTVVGGDEPAELAQVSVKV